MERRLTVLRKVVLFVLMKATRLVILMAILLERPTSYGAEEVKPTFRFAP